ncbi:hypothetical protein ACF07Q_28505 [Nocardiopsis dassonvillei]|uniref:hypothetical protein n=1 Tax=Nocardiopsis dassonvillei TaxID=2014 RepID=UPI0036FBB39B
MRYLHPATLAVARQLAEERVRWRRPRRANRVRLFAPSPGRHHRGPGFDVLTRALVGLQRLEVAAA